MGVTKQQFAEHTGDVMSVSVLPSVDPNIFVSGSCDSLAKASSLAGATDKLIVFPLCSYISVGIPFDEDKLLPSKRRHLCFFINAKIP